MKLYKYQADALRFALEKKYCALFLEMGLGKTFISLSWIQNMRDLGEIENALVIAPIYVAKSVWPSEIEKWNMNLTYTVVTGHKSAREKAMEEKTFLKIMNVENVPWLVDEGYTFDCLVFDESTLFKSSRTKRFKKIKQILSHAKARLLLTGVPSPNSLSDLWSQYYLIDEGKTFGRSYLNFMNRYFYQLPYSYVYHMRENAEIQILEKSKNNALSMKNEDWIDLPEKIELTRFVEFSPKFRKIYRDIENDFIAELDSGAVITATSPGIVVNKLMQACSGFFYDEDSETHVVDDVKAKELSQIVSDNASENILVSCSYVASRNQVLETFKDVAVQATDDSIKEWNKGNIKMMVLHPKSHSKGLNLQESGSMIVWYDLVWSMEDYVQMNSRLWRQGQKRPVRIIHLVRKDSIDEKIMRAISEKIRGNKEMINFISEEYRREL